MGIIKWLFEKQKEWEEKQAEAGYSSSYYNEESRWAYDDPNVIYLSKIYYDNLEKLEEQYSVLYNLRITEGEAVDSLIDLCKQNIVDYMRFKEACQPYGEEMPSSVPAYKRLAMIYEKQCRYEEGIEVCVAAIKNGVYDDGEKGKMRGRLARLIRKYNDNVSEEVLKLL